VEKTNDVPRNSLPSDGEQKPSPLDSETQEIQELAEGEASDVAAAEGAAGIRIPTRDDEVEVKLGPDLILGEDRASIRATIVRLALPTLAELVLMELVSMADLIMVGRLGPWAITAVGLSTQPMFVATSARRPWWRDPLARASLKRPSRPPGRHWSWLLSWAQSWR
jgi:hypothetical protein